MPAIKLVSLRFDLPPFRRLAQLEIEFADRVTVIAGHNGIGKSTILGLISNGSGLSKVDHVSYLNKAYQGNLAEIVHLDYAREYEDYKNTGSELPAPLIKYETDGEILIKKCSVTARQGSKKVRVVPRNEPHTKFEGANGLVVGPDAKVGLPTIYLGMTRMLPVGESNPTWVKSTLDKSIALEDAKFIRNFSTSVITTGNETTADAYQITTQSIRGTGKTAKHIAYSHNSKCISLGQDSLSAIATALASFKKLKREWAEYPGGLLVIDEIDAGFHPHAQGKLISALKTAARQLNLQVVATTHSLRLIEAVHPDSNPIGGNGQSPDSVIYLADTQTPHVGHQYSLEDIRHDMNLTLAPEPQKSKPKQLKIYLEDPQAHFFIERLLTPKLRKQVKQAAGVTLKAIPLSAGCENLKGFAKHDSYFSTVLIALDADSSVPKGAKNIVLLPGGKKASGKGLNPEATIYRFAETLSVGGQNYPEARQALRDAKITSNFIVDKLLSSDVNIGDRTSAKKWMVSCLPIIKRWNLIELWIKEHPQEVASFETEFMDAAKSTAALL